MTPIIKIKNEIINKKINEAVRGLKKILLASPRDIEANFLLAVAYEKNNDYKKSINQYKLTNKLKKGSLIYSRIGNLYIKINKYTLASINFKKALELNNENPEIHNNFGLLLVLNNEENKALYHFKKAMDLNSKYMDAKYNFLEISEKTNNLENIERIISTFTENYPNDQIFKFFKAIILKNQKSFNESKKILKKIKFINIEKKWEVRRLNLLGQICHNLKNYQEAFNYFKKCNNFLIKNYCSTLFYKNIYIKRIDNYLIASKISSKKKYSKIKTSISLVFLIGFPRSGTTLLDSILSCHSNINVVEEKPMLYNCLKHLPENEHINIQNHNIETAKEKYLKELENNIGNLSKYKEKIIIDKMPLNLIYIKSINKIFPNAKIIFCVRHPLDCVLSCYTQNFKINEAMVTFLDLIRSAELYDKSMELFNCNKVPKKLIHNIKYEKLIKNFEPEIKKITNFLKLNWDKKIINFHTYAKSKERIRTASYNQVTKPIYKESVYKWINYKKELLKIIPKIKKWIDFYNYK